MNIEIGKIEDSLKGSVRKLKFANSEFKISTQKIFQINLWDFYISPDKVPWVIMNSQQ